MKVVMDADYEGRKHVFLEALTRDTVTQKLPLLKYHLMGIYVTSKSWSRNIY